MTEIVAPLTWRMNLDTDGFDMSASRAGQTLRRLKGSFDDSAEAAARTERGIHKAGAGFRHFVVTLGAVRFALMDMDDFLLSFPKSIAKVGGEFERTQMLMQGLSKEADESLKKMEAVRNTMALMQFAKTAPFDVKTLSDAFVKLKSAGIDPASGSMQALINSVAKFGGSPEQMQRASVAIQQMMGKGVVSMEELRQQLGEAIPNAMELMARGMGVSMAELSDRVTKGTVVSRAALARMFLQMELDAAGAAEKMLTTMPGALSRMQTQYQIFQKIVANQGFLSTLTSAFDEITARLDSEGGQAFATSVGKTLNSVTESLVLTGRWLSNNTDLVITFGKILLATYGGSKMAGMFTAWRDRLREIQEEQMKVNAAAVRSAASEMGAMQRKANQHVRVIDQLERSKTAYANRLEAGRDRELKAVDSAIKSELDKMERLEKRRLELMGRRDAAQKKGVQKQADDIARAEKDVNSTTGKSKVVDRKVSDVITQADSGLETKQLAGEKRRQDAIDRATGKEKSAGEQLAALQERREDTLRAQRDANVERLHGMREANGLKEQKIADRLVASQERINRLEEKRGRIAEQTRSAIVGRLEKEKRASEAVLAATNEQLKTSNSGSITQQEKDAKLQEFRKLETDKRAAYEAELRQTGKVKADRKLAEAALKNNLEKQTEDEVRRIDKVKGERIAAETALQAEIDKQAARKSVQPRGDKGFIKGARVAPALTPDMVATNAALRSQIDALRQQETPGGAASNPAMQQQVDALRQKETALAANTRALNEQERAAAKAGDAMVKRTVGLTAESAALAQSATATKERIADLGREVASAKAASAQDILSNGTARERTIAIDQQIAKQRQLSQSHQADLTTLRQGAVEKERDIASRTANISGIDSEIAAKQRVIQGHREEIKTLQAASVQKGQYSAATIAKIEGLQRESVALENTLRTQQKALDVERQKQVVDNDAVTTLNRKIAETERGTGASKTEEAALRARSAEVARSKGQDDEHIRTLQSKIIAERAVLATTNDSVTALDRKTKALGAVTGGVKAAVGGIKGFGLSLLAGVGWALAFEVAMQGVMWVFDQMTKKARQTEAAIQAILRAKRGLSAEGDVETIAKQTPIDNARLPAAKSELTATEGRVKGFQDRVKARLEKGDTSSKSMKSLQESLKTAQTQAAKLKTEVDVIEDRIATAPARMVEANNTITNNKIDEEVGKKIGDIDRRLDASFDAKEEAEWQLQNKKDIDKAVSAKDSVKEKSLRDAAAQRGIDRGQLRLDRFRVMRAAEEKKFSTMTPMEWSKAQASLNDKEAALLENVTNAKSTLYQGSKKDDTGDKAPTKSTFATFIAAQNRDIAKTETDARAWAAKLITIAEIEEGAKKQVAAMTTPDPKTGQMTLNNGGKPKSKGYGLTDAQKTQGANLLRDNEVGDRILALQKDITPDLEAFKAEQDRFADVMNGDNLFKPSKGMKDADALIAKLEKMREALGPKGGEKATPVLEQLVAVLGEADVAAIKAGVSAEQYSAILGRFRNGVAIRGVQQATADLRKLTTDMKDMSVIDDRARNREEVQETVKKRKDILDNELQYLEKDGVLTDEQQMKKRDAIAAFAQFANLQYSNLAMQNRTAAQSMADQWAMGARNMENSTAKWAENFFDLLAQGKFKWKEFQQGIVREALTIKLKQTLSASIGPAMDGVSKGLSDLLGLQSPEKTLVGIDNAYDAVSGAMKVISVTGKDFMGPPEAGAATAQTPQHLIFAQAKVGFDKVIKGLEDAFTGAKSSLTTMLREFGESLLKAFDQVKSSDIGGMFSNIFGGSGGLDWMASAEAQAMAAVPFANGGIMSGSGALSLRKYANGGIANKPQLAMFGEGSKPEAYVPLPDGRTIPVTMSGGQGGQPVAQQAAEAPVININVINQTGTQATAKAGNMKFDGRQMILDVVLSAASQPGAFRDNFKAASK